MQDEKATDEISCPSPARLGKIFSQRIRRLIRKRIDGNTKREWPMLVEQVERKDLHISIASFLHDHGGRAIKWKFTNERAGVVRDPSHHIEPPRRAANAQRLREIKIRRKLGARALDQRRNRIKGPKL